MSAIIETAKIQFRRGPQADLPTSLDDAELAMATDSGRLFLGQNPVAGNPNYNRATFPFANAEVLTETSLTANQTVFDTHYRQAQTGCFISTALALNDPNDPTDWQSLVLAETADGLPSTPFIFPGNVGLVDYFCFTGTTPIRTGRLTMLYAAGLPPLLSDDAVGSSRTDVNPYTGDPNVQYDVIIFQAVITGTGIGLNVRNLSGLAAVIYLRLDAFAPSP
jgi:hypothetical protein